MLTSNLKLKFLTSFFVLFLGVFAGEYFLYSKGYQPLLKNKITAVNQTACRYKRFEDAVEDGLIKTQLGDLIPDPHLGYVTSSLPHGFRDKKDFYRDYKNFKRVLVLGDSFAWGASADPGKSFVDLLSSTFATKKILFFNTGVGGYGQNNEWAVLQKYLDVIKPHSILLAFYTGNDFVDNVTPLDRYTVFFGKWFSNTYTVQRRKKMRVFNIPKNELLENYQSFIGCNNLFIHSPFSWLRTRLFLSTRLGTLLWYYFRVSDFSTQDVLEVTHNWLLKFKTTLAVKQIPLTILVIPDRLKSKDRLAPSENYTNIIKILNALEIPYLDPFNLLSLDDYKTGENDHWNNSGHQKLFQLILQNPKF